MTPPPISDHLPIALRAFATRQFRELKEPADKKPRHPIAPASEWTLIFDTETATDAGQALRFGTYQLRKAGELNEVGLFYDPDGVTTDELATLGGYAEAHGLALLTRDEFVDQVFFRRAFDLRATIVGFNLPFDLSRLAISYGTARAPLDGDQGMRDAFTFKLSRQKFWPNVRVKHMSRTAAQISFARQMRQPDSRGERRRDIRIGARRGHFVDVRTLASALFARSFSLATLSKHLNIENAKLAFDHFDGPITDEMIGYAVRDTQATWECYMALIARLDQLALSLTKPEKLYSSAGIGKGYLKEMGIAPWRDRQPDFPPQLIATIMGSYFGGRSEVRIRRELCQVMLCDFLSMYPTVCTLMGLWWFVIADGMTWRDSTADTRALLNTVDLPALQSPSTWRELTTLVRVIPQADIFPVRACYGRDEQATIGLNYLTADQPLWFTLADCIASKLLTGKAPEIVEAITFAPGPVQAGLKSVAIAGNADYVVDPATDDFFRRLVELKDDIEKKRDRATGAERERLDIERNGVKIVANSTSYGIYVEVNVNRRTRRQRTTVLSSTAAPFSFASDKPEMPGTYFHPLLATLITGAARLMLAITERLVTDAELEWTFCDTDSMAIAKPDDMDPATFAARVQGIIDWFEALNPYEFGGSILKSEDVNRTLDGSASEPLYCWAISSKRYALFNLAADRTPIMRKVSAHGLGHLLAPYDQDDASADLPTPDKSVLKDGTVRWHADFWYYIVMAGLAGTPGRVRRDWHPALSNPAASQYSATTPELLAWFNPHNGRQPDRGRVRPFGFLLAATALPAIVATETIVTGVKRGRPKRRTKPKPVAPYDRDTAKALASAFDRDTGEPVSADQLANYADALRQYHVHPEAKFLNGNFVDSGTTRRRHVRMTGTRHIGKESNDWERQAAIGLNLDSDIRYGQTGSGSVATQVDNRDADLDELRSAVERDGLRATARRLGVDPSNLSRKLRRRSG